MLIVFTGGHGGLFVGSRQSHDTCSALSLRRLCPPVTAHTGQLVVRKTLKETSPAAGTGRVSSNCIIKLHHQTHSEQKRPTNLSEVLPLGMRNVHLSKQPTGGVRDRRLMGCTLNKYLKDLMSPWKSESSCTFDRSSSTKPIFNYSCTNAAKTRLPVFIIQQSKVSLVVNKSFKPLLQLLT